MFKRYFICVATRKMPAAIDEAAVRQAVDDGIFAAGYGNPAAAAAAAALVCPLLQIYGDDAEQHNERCFCGKNGDKNLKKMLAVWSTRRNEVVEQFEKLTPLQPEKQPASTGPPHSGKQVRASSMLGTPCMLGTPHPRQARHTVYPQTVVILCAADTPGHFLCSTDARRSGHGKISPPGPCTSR